MCARLSGGVCACVCGAPPFGGGAGNRCGGCAPQTSVQAGAGAQRAHAEASAAVAGVGRPDVGEGSALYIAYRFVL